MAQRPVSVEGVELEVDAVVALETEVEGEAEIGGL